MGIVMVRKDGTVIEMPDGAQRFHADLKKNGAARAVDRLSGRTFHVHIAEGDLHLTEKPQEVQSISPVLIRTPKLPMNK